VIAAARDNAMWCDLMCRAHGIPGTFTEHAWTNPVRTPPLYPDAVTLTPEATASGILRSIDAGPGASVKDSFATLDLPGFDVLFEAQWIHREAPGPAPTTWEVVEDAATLREWEQACGVRDLFLEALLEEAKIVYGRAGRTITSGAVITPAGGVSNVFGPEAWPNTVAMAAKLYPGRDLLGYESDPDPAIEHGFTTTGRLRVWLKP
jgi:hypothetical protein